jgi:hypothetical protein
MKSTYRQRLSSGHLAWSHRPIYPYHAEIVNAERSYRHIGPHKKDKEPQRGRASKYTGDENPRAAEQFERIYASYKPFVRRKVRAVLPMSAVQEVSADIWTAYWVNLRNVSVPDELLIPSLTRNIKWALNVAVKKWKRKHSFVDASATKEEVKYHRDLRPSTEDLDSLCERYESDLYAAVQTLDLEERKVVDLDLHDNRRPFRTVEHITTRQRAERQLAEILTGLDR